MFTRRLRKAYFAQTVIRFPKMFLSIVTNFHPVQSKEDHFCIKMFYRQLPFLSFVLIVGSMSKFCLVIYPAGIYLLKVNYRTTRTRCEICLKLIIKIPERIYFTIKLTIKIPERIYFTPCSIVSIVNYEHVIAGWVSSITILPRVKKWYKLD